jgi:hypothetical protein
MGHLDRKNFLKMIYQRYLDTKIIWKLIIGFGLVLLAALFIVWVNQAHINDLVCFLIYS